MHMKPSLGATICDDRCNKRFFIKTNMHIFYLYYFFQTLARDELDTVK